MKPPDIPPPTASHLQALTDYLESFYETIALSDQAIKMRKSVVDELEKDIQQHSGDLNEVTLQLSGSVRAGFALKSSDTNIRIVHVTSPTGALVITGIRDTLLNCGEKYQNVEANFEANQPYIIFNSARASGDFILKFTNEGNQLSNMLMSCYSEYSHKVKQLAVLFKYLAKLCHIDEAAKGALFPYCFPLLAVYYLQRNYYIPVFFEGYDMDTTNAAQFQSKIDQYQTHVPVKRIEEFELGYLWLNMLKFYCVGNFKSETYVVSIRFKNLLNKTAKGWNKKSLKIEDPCIPKRDVCRNVSHQRVFNFIHDQLKANYHHFALLQLASSPAFNAAPESNGRQSPTKNKAQTPSSTEENAELTIAAVDREQERQQNVTINLNPGAESDVVSPDANGYLLFDFHFEHLAGLESKLPIFCRGCSKSGHLTDNCPDEQLPACVPLPPPSAKHREILSNVLTDIKENMEMKDCDKQSRRRLLHDLSTYIRFLFQDAMLTPFGSALNGFGNFHSDVDICMTVKGKDGVEKPQAVCEIQRLANHLSTCPIMAEVFPVINSKVPIVKFRSIINNLEGDISLYNILGQRNTAMLYRYSQIDERVRILGYAAKEFAKKCDMGDASRGSLSSYAYIILMIYYLQQCDPPVLPVLQEFHEGEKPTHIVDGWDSWFFEGDINQLVWPSFKMNTLDVAQLWIGFLDFYAQKFDFKKHVVSVRMHRVLTKFEKQWNSDTLAIEDPFDLRHNLGSGLTKKMNTYILGSIIKARAIFMQSVEEIPSDYRHWYHYFFENNQIRQSGGAPHHGRCWICGKVNHMATSCPDRKGQNQITSSNGTYTNTGSLPLYRPPHPRQYAMPHMPQLHYPMMPAMVPNTMMSPAMWSPLMHPQGTVPQMMYHPSNMSAVVSHTPAQMNSQARQQTPPPFPPVPPTAIQSARK